MEGGVSSPRSEGTPQGGPLSPLLSNLLLDELDQELERRGHKFVRYADDCNIYVKSERSGDRVMSSIEKFLNKRLRLRVNHAKSGVGAIGERDFLGFRLWQGRQGVIIVISPKSKARFRAKVRKLTKRHRGRSLSTVITEVSHYLRGWKQYFGIAQTWTDFRDLDGWIRRRLRSYLWKQWKHPRSRISALRKLGIAFWDAVWFGRRSQGIWGTSHTKVMHRALPIAYFDKLGLMRLAST
jgi:RNA-directed DNA polymerase